MSEWTQHGSTQSENSTESITYTNCIYESYMNNIIIDGRNCTVLCYVHIVWIFENWKMQIWLHADWHILMIFCCNFKLNLITQMKADFIVISVAKRIIAKTFHCTVVLIRIRFVLMFVGELLFKWPATRKKIFRWPSIHRFKRIKCHFQW